MVENTDSFNPSNKPKGLLRDEELSPRFGEWYEDINDFTETKQKIEALLRLKQTLLEKKDSQSGLNAEELKRYKRMILDAIEDLFSTPTPPSKNN